jgi:hypothetical protein
MQTIQPANLSDEEVLRQVYLMGNDMLPKEWVEELCARLAAHIDSLAAAQEHSYHKGFEEGFQAGVAFMNDDEINPK